MSEWWKDPYYEPPEHIPPSPEAEDLAIAIEHALAELDPEVDRAGTGSIYIRFRKAHQRLGSLRIADHSGRADATGKEKYRYKWNLMKWHESTEDFAPLVVEDRSVIRFFYPWQKAGALIDHIRSMQHALTKGPIPRGESMPKTKTPTIDPEFPLAEVNTSVEERRPGAGAVEEDKNFLEEGRPYVAEDSPGPHGEIEVSIGETINTGNYNSARVHVSVRVPVEQGEESAAIRYAEGVARHHLGRISAPYRKNGKGR